MQLKNDGPRRRRRRLLENLNRSAREASGLGVLFGEVLAERMGISHTDLECLGMIMLDGGLTAGQIARASGLTTGAVTGVIDRLERAGFARREPDPQDRRKIHVRAIPKAAAAATAPYQSFGRAMERLVENYSDAQIEFLIDYFSRARDAILAEIENLKAAPKRR